MFLKVFPYVALQDGVRLSIYFNENCERRFGEYLTPTSLFICMLLEWRKGKLDTRNPALAQLLCGAFRV